ASGLARSILSRGSHPDYLLKDCHVSARLGRRRSQKQRLHPAAPDERFHFLMKRRDAQFADKKLARSYLVVARGSQRHGTNRYPLGFGVIPLAGPDERAKDDGREPYLRAGFVAVLVPPESGLDVGLAKAVPRPGYIAPRPGLTAFLQLI